MHARIYKYLSRSLSMDCCSWTYGNLTHSSADSLIDNHDQFTFEMHPRSLLVALSSVTHLINAQHGTIQAFNGVNCHGDAGAIVAFDTSVSCIHMDKRKSFVIKGELSNGATVAFPPLGDCVPRGEYYRYH